MNKAMIYCFFFISFMFFISFSYSQKGDSTITKYINTVFQTGEKLKYDVKYGFLKGGEATIYIEVVPVGYTYVYHSKAVAITTGLASKLVKLCDVYESWFDIQTSLPIKAIRDVQEQKYLSYDEALFFQKRKIVESIKYGEIRVPENTLDILSAFYYARKFVFSHSVTETEKIELPIFFDGEFYPVILKFKGNEVIETTFGMIECLKFVPLLQNSNIFKTEDDLRIWVTNDKNFIPVKIRLQLPIGSLKADLVDYTGLKNPVKLKK